MIQKIATLFSMMLLISLIVCASWWKHQQHPSEHLSFWIEIPSTILTLLLFVAFPTLTDTRRHSTSRGDGSRDADGDD